MFKSILLVGAIGVGSFGDYVAHELIKDPTHFTRIAFFNNISRPTDEAKKARIQELKAQGFEIIDAADYASPKAYEGFDCVLSFLGNHGLYLQPAIIDAAIEAGVRHFYPSEYGADITEGQNWTQRYYKYKVQTREHLDAKAQEIPDLGWTYYLLGRLTEWSVISHFGFDNKNAKAKIYGTSSGRQSLISAQDSARYLVETLKEPLSPQAKGRRRTYRISGSDPTYAEIFEILERVTGRKYDVTYLDVESAKQEEAQAKVSGDIDAELAASHKLIQGREGTLLPRPWDNDRFPQIHPKNVEETLREAFASERAKLVYGLE
ncbi:uncharacterized protein PV07_06240 [Cladophialophora immunda]|uniref:NmrA-like domain-containing protein n=1 Tax=Cladophialophora immunda TaxID=569365 RepID=A0A0D2CHF0_9EURO|nr:uncharacterized protein PV07_06240 [Cladophialophora immunda]KIW30498.1 hypothetical protein PV07_06240 [Cladophialophora immunda]OQU97108.1 hypothetical protein CLAIMM_03097 [Cladophialophora immunda]